MNNLFTQSWQVPRGSFKELEKDRERADLEMGESHGNEPGMDMRQFTTKVQSIERDILSAKEFVKRLEQSHERSKSLVKASDIQRTSENMAGDMTIIRGSAQQVKKKIEELQRDNEVNQRYPGCGKGSATDRSRMAVTAGLGKKLREVVDSFNTLRTRMEKEHRETVERRVYTVTGEKADAREIDEIIETGKSDEIFQQAVKQQGRGKALDVLAEMQERHDAVKDLNKSLLELHQVFLDMATLVEAQGEILDNIEVNVNNAVDFQQTANKQLHQAVVIKRNTRKWKMYGVIACIAIIVVLIIVLLPTIVSISNSS